MIVKNSVIRTIYLYLFALIGLGLIVMGSVKMLDMGLKMFVFTKAEEPERLQSRILYPPIAIEKLQTATEGGTELKLTDAEKAQLKQFLEDYKKSQEEQSKIDYLASSRQREASNNIAMILIGLPLYLYHWRIIRRETKEA